MYHATYGGAPSPKSQKLRKIVRKALTEGWTPEAIRHEILTSDCTKAEQDKLLKELHMEVVR